MFDQARFDSTPKFVDFTYWFRRVSDATFEYGTKDSFLIGNPEIMGTLNLEISDDLSIHPADVISDFKQFQLRPEYSVGSDIKLQPGATSNNSEYMVDTFETLIVGFTFIRTLNLKKNPDNSFEIAARFLNWIRSTDFYSCPASTRFHDSDPCGLIYHTLNVYQNMMDLRKVKKFQNTNYDSITIVSLGHDLTKIGNYELYLRNVKNEVTGDWEHVPSYRWKANPFPFGHGVASMYIISQFFNLTIDELLALRWHMAEYRVASQEVGELEEACERYPLVRMVQFADQLACVKY